MKTLMRRIMNVLEEERIGRLTRELQASMLQWGTIDPEGQWEPRIQVQQYVPGNRILMAYGSEGHCVEVIVRPLPDGSFEENAIEVTADLTSMPS